MPYKKSESGKVYRCKSTSKVTKKKTSKKKTKKKVKVQEEREASDIVWKCSPVKRRKGSFWYWECFWSLVEGDGPQVLVEDTDGILIKKEFGRAALTIGSVDKDIEGQFGRRKSY